MPQQLVLARRGVVRGDDPGVADWALSGPMLSGTPAATGWSSDTARLTSGQPTVRTTMTARTMMSERSGRGDPCSLSGCPLGKVSSMEKVDRRVPPDRPGGSVGCAMKSVDGLRSDNSG